MALLPLLRRMGAMSQRSRWNGTRPRSRAKDLASKSNIIYIYIYSPPLPLFQNGAESGYDMCFAPRVLGVPTKTRLESRI